MEINIDPNMSAVEWLNHQFASDEAKDNFEGFAAKLTSNLQLHLYRTQQGLDDLASQLPRLGMNIARNIPRTGTSAEYLIKDVSNLENSLKECVSASADSVQRLRAMEIVKSRMEATYKSLESQDNWDALIANIKEVIASGDLDAIGGRIVALQKCFLSLADAANHEERKEQLEDVKNRIEGLLIPRLVSLLTSVEPWKPAGSPVGLGSESLALKIVTIFGIMERKSTIKRVVKDCRLKQMVNHWEDLVHSLQVENGTTLDECISTYYDDLLTSWHAQIPLFSATFPEPVLSLLEHFHLIFVAVSPSMENLIDSAWKQCDSSTAAQDFLALLLEIKRTLEMFVKTMEKECVGNHHCQTAEDLTTLIKKPMTNWTKKYSDVEKIIIFAEINKIQMDVDDREKTSQILTGAVNRIGSLCYSVMVRCLQITNGVAIDKVLDLILEACKTHMGKVETYGKAVYEKASAKMDSFTDFNDSDLEVLADLVKVLQHCGDLLVQVNSIVELLRQQNLNSTSQSHFSAIQNIVQQTANATFQQILSFILRPVDVFLDSMPNLSSWTLSSNKAGIELPSYGLDPQEYITRVGNYLLTLPQLMDPLLSSDSNGMKVLKSLINFGGISISDESLSMAEASIQATICAAMDRVTSAVLKLKHLTNFGIRQLHCDLRYLQNVVEDFAVPSSAALNGLLDLLPVPPEDWTARKSHAPAEVAAFVAKLRNFD